jgi:hypothetical protein
MIADFITSLALAFAAPIIVLLLITARSRQ